MALIVQKYGGTSVGSLELINQVAEKVKASYNQGHQLVVVVSAMSGETNRLLGMAGELSPHHSRRETDVLLSTGEQVTASLLAMALHHHHCPAYSFCGWQIPIRTDNVHGKARIEEIDTNALKERLAQGRVCVVAGFQGLAGDGSVTTLGRGGSDTTAVALAAALQAQECRIYTDVDGVYTADPRIVGEARRMDRVTFEEMLELASLGSRVLQIRSVEFAGKYRVPLRVLSAHGDPDDSGTLVTYEDENEMEQAIISGIASSRNEAKLSILHVPDKSGIAASILTPIAEENIEVDMIVQNISEDGTTNFTFTVQKPDATRAAEVLKQVAKEIGSKKVLCDTNIAKVSAVGIGMKSHAGVASTMFAALSNENINIQMITTSEIRISVVVEEKYYELATRTLHRAFGLDKAE